MSYVYTIQFIIKRIECKCLLYMISDDKTEGIKINESLIN